MCYKPPFTAKKTWNPRPISTPPGMAVGCLGPRVPSSSLSVGDVDASWVMNSLDAKERDWSDDCQGFNGLLSNLSWMDLSWMVQQLKSMTCLESHQSTRPAALAPEQMLIWIIFEIEKSSFTISIHVDCHLPKNNENPTPSHLYRWQFYWWYSWCTTRLIQLMDISQPMDYPYLIKSILSTLPYVFVTQTLGGF